MDFYTISEIEHFTKIAGSKYRKDNANDVNNGFKLRPLTQKTNYWAEKSLIEDFTFKKDNHWHWSGTIKHYLWVRIFRKGDSKKVYFIVGVHDGTLYIQLNCQRSNHSEGSTKPLPQDKIDRISKIVEESVPDIIISKNEIMGLNWDLLIQKSKQFILDNKEIYDILESIAISDELNEIKNKSEIIEAKIPEVINSKIQSSKHQYSGSFTNYIEKARKDKQTGDLGEDLVLKHEKKKLANSIFSSKINEIKKMKDGEGYDILSFDPNTGEEIHIEVKSTTGNSDEPFYMSLNEFNYLCDFPENYKLYRIYNIRKTPVMYILVSKQIQDLQKKSLVFEMSKQK